MYLNPSVNHVAISTSGLFLFLLTGDYTIASIPVGPLSFCIAFIIGITQTCNGNANQLRFAFASSCLLILLSLINCAVNPNYFQDFKLFVSLFLICVSPLIGWAYINFRLINLSSKSLFVLNIFLFVQYIAINSLAGRNVSYRYAAFCFFVSLYLIVQHYSQSSFCHFFSLVNASFPILFLYCTVHAGSRGGIFVLIILLTIWILAIQSKSRINLGLYTIKFKTIYRFFLIAGSFLAIPVFIRIISPRAYLFFEYFLDPQSVLDSSSGTLARSDWYSNLFSPDLILKSEMFSFEKLPVWGRYPHNFILDSLGNLGLILMLLSLISSVLIFFNFYTSIVPGKNNSLGLSFSALALSIIIISSLISGSLWDYFSIFSGLAFLPISFPLSRVKSQ